MKFKMNLMGVVILTFVCSIFYFLIPQNVNAHCDTMEGPVIKDAKAALEKGDVTPVLKWVKKEHEKHITTVFKETLIERKKFPSPKAKEQADMHFFEELVRIHRAGEGAPYEGIKPAGTKLEPAVEESDKALESGSVDALVKQITDSAATGIRHRYEKASETKKHKDKSVEAGREFVEAYITFIHYVENLDIAVKGTSAHHEEAAGEAKAASDHTKTTEKHKSHKK